MRQFIPDANDTTPRARILEAVKPPCGPATRAVLRGLAKNRVQHHRLDMLLEEMLKKGELQAYGGRKNATYGLPGGH